MAHEPSAMHHVQDEPGQWHIFDTLFGGWDLPLGPPLFTVFGHEVKLTKFMILELVAAARILLIYIPIAKRARTGELPKGGVWNAFEVLLTFVRNESARPTIGDKEGGKFVPFLWTRLLFILFFNVLGLIS